MQATPHTPADTEIENLIRPKSGRWIATLGVALFTGPVWGMLGTVIGMIRAFNTLAEDEASSTEAISKNISFALKTTMIGIPIGLLGAILIIIALLVAKNRENWFFRWTVALSFVWSVAVFPYGVIVGLPVFILFFARRDQFSNQSEA